MAVTGIGTYASYTNSYGNTQNAGNKTGRTYKNAHEYKNYLTQKSLYIPVDDNNSESCN